MKNISDGRAHMLNRGIRTVPPAARPDGWTLCLPVARHCTERKKLVPMVEDKDESDDLGADAAELDVQLDLEIGRIAADAAIEEQYSDFEYAFSDEIDPQFVYQSGDSFIVVETELLDGTEEADSTYCKEDSDGLVCERGTRQYLELSIEDWLSNDHTRKAAEELRQALSADKVEYLLVTINVSESEVTSVECAPFEL